MVQLVVLAFWAASIVTGCVMIAVTPRPVPKKEQVKNDHSPRVVKVYQIDQD